MNNPLKTLQYSSVLLVSICFMLCISTACATDTQSISPLLLNPFSSSSSPVFIGESNSGVFQPPSQGEYILTLQADRTRVYFQGSIRFDATLVTTATNAPVRGATITFRNLQDDADIRRAVTNSFGRAVAGAYARLEPPQYEYWIAETVIDNKLYSSQPVSVQVLEFNAPIVSSDAQIFINPFAGSDIILPFPSSGSFFSGHTIGVLRGGWVPSDRQHLHYPSFTGLPFGSRLYFPMFTAPPSGSQQFPLFRS